MTMKTREERRAAYEAQVARRKANRQWAKEHDDGTTLMGALFGPSGTSGARFEGFSVDRESGVLRGPGGRVGPITAETTARVETSGEIDRRLSLTRTAVGGILFGPAGVIVGGLAKKKRDSRAIYVTVSGDGYEWVIEAKAKKEREAREWAAKVNSAAR
jgi:hypothetical protein